MVTSPRCSFSFESLTAPLNGAKSAGEWLRYDPVYDQIREARRCDDPDLSLGIWQRDLKKSDWENVESLCLEVLSHRSKDLQIAAWLTETWIALDGLEGLGRGLKVMGALCQAFWPTLYPPMEDNDLEYRLRILEWLDDALTERLIRVPITGSDIKEHGYTLADWMSAHQLETVAKRSPDGAKLLQAADAQNQPTLAKFTQAFDLTSSSYIQALKENVTNGQKELENFKHIIDRLTNNQSPSYRTILDRLSDLSRLLTSSTMPPPLAPSSFDPQDEHGIEHLTIPRSQEELMNRKGAYQQLQTIADYLASIEPHSPTPNLLKRIVTWQDKNLAEIFAEFGDSPQELTLLARLIGKT